MPSRFDRMTRRVWTILSLAMKKYWEIDGAQWAAGFAHYAFFSLFPLIVLAVTVASAFIDRDRAGAEVIAYVETYIPISGEMQSYIFDTISGVVNARGQAGAVAFLMLVWAAMQFFTTLICATNRAWGAAAHNWWRLPLKSLVLVAIMGSSVLLGIALPVLANMAKRWLFPVNEFSSWVYDLGSFLLLLLAVFLSLSLFYRLAPRRPTRFAEVWAAAAASRARVIYCEGSEHEASTHGCLIRGYFEAGMIGKVKVTQ